MGGLNGVLWVQCGSLRFKVVSQGFFEVHLGSVRFKVFFFFFGGGGVKWGSMGSMWFAEVQSGSQGFFEVRLASVRFMEVRWGFWGLNGVL